MRFPMLYSKSGTAFPVVDPSRSRVIGEGLWWYRPWHGFGLNEGGNHACLVVTVDYFYVSARIFGTWRRVFWHWGRV
jgi:hypothetical protein